MAIKIQQRQKESVLHFRCHKTLGKNHSVVKHKKNTQRSPSVHPTHTASAPLQKSLFHFSCRYYGNPYLFQESWKEAVIRIQIEQKRGQSNKTHTDMWQSEDVGEGLKYTRLFLKDYQECKSEKILFLIVWSLLGSQSVS